MHEAVGRRGASVKVGQIPVVEVCRGSPPAGTSKSWNSVCVYSLCCPWVGGSPNDSWPHSLSLLWLSLIWGPRAIGGQSAAGGAKSQVQEKN